MLQGILTADDLTQDEKWQHIYMTMMLTSLSANIAIFRAIISKEVHDMLNWVRANKKLMNASELKEDRLVKFKELLALAEVYKRKNQSK